MQSAPRDGTVIELVCIYGIAPWYMSARWNGRRWEDACDPTRGVRGDETLRWRPRPHAGDPASYVDPTNGAQNSQDYWQAAMWRRSHGLPNGEV
jgi:hypothetical protein